MMRGIDDGNSGRWHWRRMAGDDGGREERNEVKDAPLYVTRLAA